MAKRGGEPITINSAVATGLLTAVEEIYRNQYKNKKVGGKNSKKDKDPLTGLATSAILATAAKNLPNNNLNVIQPGGDNNNKNEPLSGLATSALLATAAKQVSKTGGKKNNKKDKNGGSPMEDMYGKKTGGMLGSPIEASHLLLDRASDTTVGGSKNNKNNKDNKKVGGDTGISHDFSGYRSEPAQVTDPLTIVMNPDGSMPKVGGGKKKRNNKKVGGDTGISHDFSGYRSEPAPTDAKFTILMEEKQVGGKNKNKNKKGGSNGIYGISNEDVYNSAVGTLSVPGPSAQMGGKNKNNNKDKKGGKNNKKNNQPEGEEANLDNAELSESSDVSSLPEISGGSKRKNKKNNKNNKKVYGGLADLSALLSKLANTV